MKKDVTVLVWCLMVLCASTTIPGQKKRCCGFEPDECQVFQKNGESICEKSISRLNGEEVVLPAGSSSISLLSDDVSFYTDGCNAVQCEPTTDTDDSWSFPDGCETYYCDKYHESFLFMKIPFVLRGNNVTQIEFHISWPNNDKGDLPTRIAVNTTKPIAGYDSTEDTFVLSGVGMLNPNENDVSLLFVQPGASVVVSAYSPDSNDTILVNVPDCHDLHGKLATSYHCTIESAATFLPVVQVEYNTREDLVHVSFTVKAEHGLTPGYNVSLLLLPAYEEVDTDIVPYDHAVVVENKTTGPYTLNYTFRNVRDGTYIVTVKMVPTDDYTWDYWGRKGKVGRSNNFTVFRQMSPTTAAPHFTVFRQMRPTTAAPPSSEPLTSPLFSTSSTTSLPTSQPRIGHVSIFLIVGVVVSTVVITLIALYVLNLHRGNICEILKKSNVSLHPVSSNASIIRYEPRLLESSRRIRGPDDCSTVFSEVLSMEETEVGEVLLVATSYRRELSMEEYCHMIPHHRPITDHDRDVERAATAQNVYEDIPLRHDANNNVGERNDYGEPDRRT